MATTEEMIGRLVGILELKGILDSKDSGYIMGFVTPEEWRKTDTEKEEG